MWIDEEIGKQVRWKWKWKRIFFNCIVVTSSIGLQHLLTFFCDGLNTRFHRKPPSF